MVARFSSWASGAAQKQRRVVVDHDRDPVEAAGAAPEHVDAGPLDGPSGDAPHLALDLRRGA